jgi:hypothetical protein
VSEARRLKVLTDENAKLKKLLAEAMLVTPVAKRQVWLTFVPNTRSVSGGRVQRSVSIAHQCAIAADVRTTEPFGSDCESWQQRGGGMVIAVCFS